MKHSRFFTRKDPFEDTSSLNKYKNYLFDLSYLSLLKLHGLKAFDFLQGQITSDLRLCTENHAIPAAACNLKGRLLVLMHAISWQGLQILVPRDLLEKTKLSLEKSAQLSRVSLVEETQLKVYGFYLQNPKDLLAVNDPLPQGLYEQVSKQSLCYFHLGSGFYIFIIQSEIEEEFCKIFLDKKQLLGSMIWHRLRLMHHQLEIYPESRGMFLPHRLNLHHTDYLAFNKGCYKGQEIIARMHYKSVFKHELRLCTVNTKQPLFLGQKLTNEGVEVGELVDFSTFDDTDYLIAVSLLKEAPLLLIFEGHQSPILLKPFTLNQS